jgi:hypothetical protein
MSDEPKPKPPVRPTPHNSGGEQSSTSDAIGNFVIALCVVAAVAFFVFGVLGAGG